VVCAWVVGRSSGCSRFRLGVPQGSEAYEGTREVPAVRPGGSWGRAMRHNRHMTRDFETLAIHAGQDPDPRTGAVVTPIYQVSTYKQDGIGNLRNGFEYGRANNPTRVAWEECLAALEGGTRAFAFASGLAAEDTFLRTVLRPGDHIVGGTDAYGGTYRLFVRGFGPWGIEFTPVNLADIDAVRAAIKPNTRVLWCETPSNPLLDISDISALAQIAHEHNVLLVIDNTFASPYLQQPLELGADMVVHSTTKYLGGHSDVVGGALVLQNGELAEKIAFHLNALGAIPGPFDSWLALRGVKTLAVRMERHCDNAERIVEALLGNPAISTVYYPGLADHPGHDIAAKQMRRFGGMISFQMRGGAEAARAICERTQLFTLGESLGGVESLIEHPAAMTHASAANSPLAVPEDLVRLSVGIESADDLIEDLKAAF
jgi:cystathionine gamma-synthase